jgi:hypothetical protein
MLLKIVKKIRTILTLNGSIKKNSKILNKEDKQSSKTQIQQMKKCKIKMI